MIDVRKALKISQDTTGKTRVISDNLRRSFTASKISREKLLGREIKIQKKREDTFRSLKNALAEREKKGGGGGLLGAALGLGGVGRIGRRFGRGGGGLRGGGGAPKLPRGPLAKGLSKFGRIGPMAVATTGLDFFLRKQQGQSNIQAAGGAASGLAGFVGGAKFGATVGSFIAPGLGTAAGGLIGGAVGGLFGGNLFDRLYGQNILRAGSDLRRVREEDITRQSKTLFGENLDKFEIVLGKFEKIAPELGESTEKIIRVRERVGKLTTGTKFPVEKIVSVAFDLLSLVVPQAKIAQVSGKLNLANRSKIVLKKKNANLLDELAKSFKQQDSIILQKNKLQERIAAFIKARRLNLEGGFRKFSQDASKIKPRTVKELLEFRMNKAFNRNLNKIISPRKNPVVRKNVLKRRADKVLEDLRFEFKGEGQVFRDTQEIDGILQTISRALRQGTVPEGMNIEQFRKTIKAFQDVMTDMMDSKLMKMSKTELDDIFRELRLLGERGEVPRGATSQPRIERFLKDIFSEVGPPPGGMVGGRFSGPDTGYLAVLHGTERVIPEENPHTRSRGTTGVTEQVVVINGGGGENQQAPNTSQMMGGGQTQVVSIREEVSAYDLATKYSQMIASATV